MTRLEDRFINSLENRLIHLKKISKNITDRECLKEYFDTRLNRLILDYFIHNRHFESGKTLTKELNLGCFSDIEIFTETNDILVSLKAGQKSNKYE